MTIVTRFAPSPTGLLHIGSARTALFNYLFAKHHGGQYLLRIEDTDRARSTPEAVDAIFEGLGWLGLMPDAPAIFQFERAARHLEVAQTLLNNDQAYYCQCAPDDLIAMRAQAREEKRAPGYSGACRDCHHGAGAIRLKTPTEGATKINDMVQGCVEVENKQLDDFILVRSDGTPTYMLSVVVDDYDMGVTHVIRGDDHLTNAFRQSHLYNAMGWSLPFYAHIPLIHGGDGAKLSKRHGALGVMEYEKMGFLSEAMCNYLLRLGWAHGDDEIISRQQAIDWFDVQNIGKSAARFDVKKLMYLNAHYLRHMETEIVVDRLAPFLSSDLDLGSKQRLLKGLPGLAQRAETLCELAKNVGIYTEEYITHFDEKAKKILTPEAILILKAVDKCLSFVEAWDEAVLESSLRGLANDLDVGFGKIAQPLRAALTGRAVSPGVFDVLLVLGKDLSRRRLSKILQEEVF